MKQACLGLNLIANGVTDPYWPMDWAPPAPVGIDRFWLQGAFHLQWLRAVTGGETVQAAEREHPSMAPREALLDFVRRIVAKHGV